jgi:hypothetical protein
MLSAHIDFLHDVVWATIKVSPFGIRTTSDDAALDSPDDFEYLPPASEDNCESPVLPDTSHNP